MSDTPETTEMTPLSAGDLTEQKLADAFAAYRQAQKAQGECLPPGVKWLWWLTGGRPIKKLDRVGFQDVVDGDERPVRITLTLAQVEELGKFVSQVNRGPQ